MHHAVVTRRISGSSRRRRSTRVARRCRLEEGAIIVEKEPSGERIRWRKSPGCTENEIRAHIDGRSLPQGSVVRRASLQGRDWNVRCKSCRLQRAWLISKVEAPSRSCELGLLI